MSTGATSVNLPQFDRSPVRASRANCERVILELEAPSCEPDNLKTQVHRDTPREVKRQQDESSLESKSNQYIEPHQLAFTNILNPLEDPVIMTTLQAIQMTGRQLVQISVRELNKRLVGCSNLVVTKLKRCRRTLKNRGYAKNCRKKRIEAKVELERENGKLMFENRKLRERNKMLAQELERLDSQCRFLSVKLDQVNTAAGNEMKGACADRESRQPCNIDANNSQSQYQANNNNKQFNLDIYSNNIRMSCQYSNCYQARGPVIIPYECRPGFVPVSSPACPVDEHGSFNSCDANDSSEVNQVHLANGVSLANWYQCSS